MTYLRNYSYDNWRELAQGQEAPALYIDLDQYDANQKALKELADKGQKKLRLATKSLRIPYLINYSLQTGSPTFSGLLTFSVLESHYLFTQGHKDLLVAYPTSSILDLKLALEILEGGGSCTLTFDHLEHLKWAQREWQKLTSRTLPICLDVDASLKFMGLHLGVFRSSLLSLSDIKKRLDELSLFPSLALQGLLHYEAQIAGLPDRDREFIVIQKIKELIRSVSKKVLKKERLEIMKLLNQKNINLKFFNGGGTGSMDSSVFDSLTEVTAGSGLLHSHLFDKYSNQHTYAALFIVLPITRFPSANHILCQSGGFIASGETSKNKSPQIHLPKNIATLSAENFGEVQTPFLKLAHQNFNLGDPVIIRPCKAGEIMERFNKVILVRSQKIVDVVETYRGLNRNFF